MLEKEIRKEYFRIKNSKYSYLRRAKCSFCGTYEWCSAIPNSFNDECIMCTIKRLHPDWFFTFEKNKDTY